MKLLHGSPLGVGLGAALLASACCAPPVLLATFGLATSSLLLAWLDLKPVFLALTVAVLAGGSAVSLLHSKRACSAKRSRRRLWLYPLSTAVSFGIGYWLVMGIATPHLYAQIYASQQKAVAHPKLIIEPNGKAVALHRAAIKVNPGCDGCAVTLAAAIRGLPGVHAAEIDIPHKEAVVLYDPTRTSTRTIQAKIPYRWYFNPRLGTDVALGVPSVSAEPAVDASSMLLLIAVTAGILALTSAAVWAGTRSA
jgi:copper chaperone CopZ